MSGGQLKNGQIADSKMVMYIMISGSFGILITMTALLCVTINGPISMNITGIFKDVGLTVAGFLFFSDTKLTASNLVGTALSFIGATYFCYSKYSASQEAAKKSAKVKTK